MINLKNKKILITGGHGFIGRWVVENLIKKRKVNAKQIIIPDAKKDDLRNFNNCQRLIRKNEIDVVIHLAALVGGIQFSDNSPATQYYNNILMDLQIVEACKDIGVEKVVLVSSACAYPRDTAYPLDEDKLWDGLPQETNRAYGIAKRILTIQAEAYRKQYGLNCIVVIPNNSYGPGDNFHEEYSHVIPSIIRKCLNKDGPLVIWGDGTPTRDFLYVKDFAEGVLLAAEKLETNQPVNLGTGKETSVKKIVEIIRKLTNHEGKIVYDLKKPSGQPRRLVDISRARQLLNFYPQYTIEQGLKETVEWYKNILKQNK